ncbi:MAG: hypothetical protein SGI73_08945, partial [Chloroflexota bacterium]|nr:hypothetical protein [Chloroflexota bacterium]
MRDFSRGVMRQYVSTQQFAASDQPTAPAWQSDTALPLAWEENEAPAADQTVKSSIESPAAPTAELPSAPTVPPAEKTVQRESAPPSPAKQNDARFPPALMKLLENDRNRNVERERLRTERLTKFSETLSSADPDTAQKLQRRRGKMSVSYVDTKPLANGEDTVQRQPEPTSAPAVGSDDESNPTLNPADDPAVDQGEVRAGTPAEDQALSTPNAAPLERVVQREAVGSDDVMPASSELAPSGNPALPIEIVPPMAAPLLLPISEPETPAPTLPRAELDPRVTAAPPISAAPDVVPPTPFADAIQRASETAAPSILPRSEPVTLSASAAPDAVPPSPISDTIQRASETAVPPIIAAPSISPRSEPVTLREIAAPDAVQPTPFADAIQRASETVAPSISPRSEPVTPSASAAPDA